MSDQGNPENKNDGDGPSMEQILDSIGNLLELDELRDIATDENRRLGGLFGGDTDMVLRLLLGVVLRMDARLSRLERLAAGMPPDEPPPPSEQPADNADLDELEAGWETTESVFDSLVNVSAEDARRLFDAAGLDEVAVALKGVATEGRDTFMDNLAGDDADKVRQKLEDLGPVRLRDVDAAQGRLVALAEVLGLDVTNGA